MLGGKTVTALGAQHPWSYRPSVPSVSRKRSETGAGLFGLLLVVAILGVLAVLSMSATEVRLDTAPPGVSSTEAANDAAPAPAWRPSRRLRARRR